jgi:membrane-associated phospholipid phosphatase
VEVTGRWRRPRWRNNLIGAILLVLYGGLSYAWTNAHPLRAPSLLPRVGFEAAIPVLPWTSAIYVSYFALFLYTALRIVRREWFGRAVSFVGSVITGCLFVFLLFPTTMLRPPCAAEEPMARVLGWIRMLDPPNNCCPSMHVAVVVACAFLAFRARLPERMWIAVWAGLVAMSTLTTRQHYLLDVLAGGALASGLYPLFFSRKRPAPARP